MKGAMTGALRRCAWLWLCVAAALSSTSSSARTGMGDPVQPWREKQPDEGLVLDGHLRLRSALYSHLDLDRPAGVAGAGSTVLWAQGTGDGDITGGSDLRLRLSPSIFLGDVARVVVEVDLLDNVALGARPRFTPFAGTTGLVAAAPFAAQPSLGDVATLRTAYGEVLLPIGVLSAGRMPSHFGLGIAANDGADVDDDQGDRADRVAFTMPVLGHVVSAAFDIGASGPSALGARTLVGQGPTPRSARVGEQSLSLALLRFHAPWELDMLTHARTPEGGRTVVDYGAALSYEWQDDDVAGYWVAFDDGLGDDAAAIVHRGYQGGVADGWLRVESRRLRVEAEVVGAAFRIDNASPLAGVTLRTPITGTPWGGVVVVEGRPLHDEQLLALSAELGVASSDPAPGFPLTSPAALSSARPGDVFGSQLDGARDTQQNAFRLHPLHRVDLILWRTLLGGVSEAAYARAHVVFAPAQDMFRGLKIEGNAIYSHALDADSAPGGANPLGFEVDGAVVVPYDAFSLRLDAGWLLPLGGLGARATADQTPIAPTPATMILLRLAYAL
jgi:uncharacterized protein (TIGR04551 family)